MRNKELYELCKDVYELTGWEGGYNWQWFLNDGLIVRSLDDNTICPLYTSDYLLEKLPVYVRDGMIEITSKQGQIRDGWMAFYADKDGYSIQLEGIGKTPLKSLLKLTIVLHEAGELEAAS